MTAIKIEVINVYVYDTNLFTIINSSDSMRSSIHASFMLTSATFFTALEHSG
jgi:hypothetical protein